MCGIAAIINFKRPLGLERYRIEHMVESLKHRGPDEDHILIKNNALLGHARLSIIDVAHGKQPLTRNFQGKEYTIVYNGMLYNYEELKKELISLGFSLETSSDTEVLLVAYFAWKEDCLLRFNGIFAFVIYSEEEVFVARDQMGVKPLYYVMKSDGEWIFASEMKAFFSEGSVRPILTKDKFMKMIALGPSTIPGETIYKNIKSLMPGHYLKIIPNRFKLVKYYTLQAQLHQDDLETTIQKVKHLVKEAIKRQCISEVGVGSMLSGGLDSSIVCARASQYLKPFKTFSLDYEENDQYFESSSYQSSQDAPYIAEMVRQCGSDHTTHVIPQLTLASYLKRAMQARDMPAMADIDSSLWWFCEQIRPKVKVVLSGECADEIFGGYPWFYREDLIHMDTFPWLKSLPAKIELVHKEFQTLDFYGIRKQAYETALTEVSFLETDCVQDRIARKMTYLCKDYFMQTLLSRQDAMASAVGLEGRVPFADIELVNYVYNIPWTMKYLEEKEKGLLRAAFEDELPSMVRNRKKSPYPKTYHPLYTQAVGEKLREYVQSDSMLCYLFDETMLNQLIDSGGKSFDQPWFGQLMKGPQLLAYLYQTAMWLEEYQVLIDF